MDRNSYYGGESASLNLTQARVFARAASLGFAPPTTSSPSCAPAPPPPRPRPATTSPGNHAALRGAALRHGACALFADHPLPHRVQLWEKYRPGEKAPAELGRANEYNVDSCPKFIMANGAMVQMLLHTDVVKYLEFKAVDGSFVVRDKRVHKVPANDLEALKSPLMGLFEKRRARSFFIFVQDYVSEDPRTWQGLDLRRMPMRAVFDHFGLDEGTTDFIGHSLALQQTDEYMSQAALPTVLAIQMYAHSMARFGGGSPYIYPLYGLGELPQAFARLSAVYGGTYMLNKPDCEPVFDDEGRVCGVRSGEETARAKLVVGDPSYFKGKTRRTGQVARAMCLMSHPIPNTGDGACTAVRARCGLREPADAVRVRVRLQPTARRSSFRTSRCRVASRTCTSSAAATATAWWPKTSGSPSSPPGWRGRPPRLRTSWPPAWRFWARWSTPSCPFRTSTSRWPPDSTTAATSARATTRRATLRDSPRTCWTSTRASPANSWTSRRTQHKRQAQPGRRSTGSA